MDPNLLNALTSHSPALVVGAVLCLLIWSAKLPAFAIQWQRLPAWARPLVPAVLALVGGVGEALMQGQKWWVALLVQCGAALPAIGYALPSPVIAAPKSAEAIPVTVSDPKILDRDTDPQ